MPGSGVGGTPTPPLKMSPNYILIPFPLFAPFRKSCQQRPLSAFAFYIAAFRRKLTTMMPVGMLSKGGTRPMVFLVANCRRGGAVAIETEDGECTVERKQFTDIIKTFKNEHLLTVSVKDGKLTIARFSMPVNDFFATSKPPEKFDWFGPQPQMAGNHRNPQKGM
jgi:hypothetical protein